MDKTQAYIEANIGQTDRPLAVALSAYALTLAGSQHSDTLVKRLSTMAKSSPEGTPLHSFVFQWLIIATPS